MTFISEIKHMSLGDKAFGACIVLVALVEAWNGALAESPRLAATMPDFGLEAVWPFIPLGLLLLAGLIWLTKAIRHSRETPTPENAAIVHPLSLLEMRFPTNRWDEPLQRVFGRSYINETVMVDGFEFIKCTFENVTLKFQGMRSFRFTDCAFKAQGQSVKMKIETDNAVVGQTIELFNQAGLLVKTGEMTIYPGGKQ